MKTPKVSIVTVNYKQRAVTCELLDTIAALSYPNLETIVVDNAQASDDSEIYKVHLPNVKIINAVETRFLLQRKLPHRLYPRHFHR